MHMVDKCDDSLQLPNNVSCPYRHYVFLPIPVIIQVYMPLLPFVYSMPGAFLLVFICCAKAQ